MRGSFLTHMGVCPQNNYDITVINSEIKMNVKKKRKSDPTLMFNRAFLYLDYKGLSILNSFRMAGNISQ